MSFRDRLFQKLSHLQFRISSRDYAPKISIERPSADKSLIHVKDYMKHPSIKNTHFQLHNNLQACSNFDFIFPTNYGLLHLNTQTMQTHPLLTKSGVCTMDTHKSLLVAGHMDSYISLIDLETSNLLLQDLFREQAADNLLNSLRFVDDRSGALKVAVAGNRANIEVFDISHPKNPLIKIPADHFCNVITLSKDFSTVAAGFDDEVIKIYDLRTSKVAHTLKGHKHYTFALDYHSDQVTLASGNQDYTTRIWDLRMNEATQVLPAKNFPIGYLKYIQNSKMLVTGEYFMNCQVYDAVDQYKIHSTLEFYGELVGICFDAAQREMYVGAARIDIGDTSSPVSPGILRASVGPELRTLGMKDLELKTTSSIQSTQPSSKSKGFFSGGFKLI